MGRWGKVGQRGWSLIAQQQLINCCGLGANWNYWRTSVSSSSFFLRQNGLHLKSTAGRWVQGGIHGYTGWVLPNHSALFEVVGRAPAVRFICTRPETTLARYRRLFITFIFIQFSKQEAKREEGRGSGQGQYTRLNYEYLCNLRHVGRLVSSVRLATPRFASPRPTSSLFVLVANVIVVAALLLARAICVGKSQLPKHTLWVFFVTLAAFYVPSDCWVRPGRWGASCSSAVCSVQFHLNLLEFHILFWQFLRTLTKCR